MRLFRLVLLSIWSLLVPGSVAAQAPPRDPQAVAILQQSLVAMGRVIPSDSVASGTVVVVAGSRTENGTMRVLTRGTNQSAEQIETPEGKRSIIYSQGLANRIDGTGTATFTLELAASSQSPCFPLVLIAGALNNPDIGFQYLGLESLGGSRAHHLRAWNTFSSNAKLRLAEFTVKDLWIDAASGLTLRISYTERAGGGAESRIPVVVLYSDYRNVGGVLYPFSIQKSLNGTPWAKITIFQVAFNTGLTDKDFPIQ